MADKPLRWAGASVEELRAFPDDARRQAGYQLRRLQQGLQPDDAKPMASVGAGVAEIRIHTRVEHRVFYVAKFAEAIYVLQALCSMPSRNAAGIRDRPTWSWAGVAWPRSSATAASREKAHDDQNPSRQQQCVSRSRLPR